jgi:hypothetical protein
VDDGSELFETFSLWWCRHARCANDEIRCEKVLSKESDTKLTRIKRRCRVDGRLENRPDARTVKCKLGNCTLSFNDSGRI